jgi:RNA polymerase sigma factor (sigma-70 family)
VLNDAKGESFKLALAAEALVDPAASLEAAFREHHPWLVRRLALVVGDAEEARDLAQQVFLRAAERWPLPPEQDVARWLAVVGLRLALNERRRRRRWGFLAIRETDASWALEVNPDLWRGLQALDPRTRAALVLTVLDGYTQDEVATALGVPRGTVASWLSRARDQLRVVFSERDR